MALDSFAVGYGTSGWGLGGWGYLWGQGPAPAYYKALITSEYQTCPNFLEWLNQVVLKLDDISATLAYFNPAFDLDIAAGPQLDVVGALIGASRVVPFQPSGGVSPTLDDATYRLLLRARIAQNTWSGTIDALQSVWSGLFPGGSIVIQDSQDMTATVILTGAFSSITQDLITNGMIVPRPEGVLYTYVFSTLPIFGFDSDNAYIAGFDHGHWS